MNHDCSTKALFLCTAVKLQSCHMLAHWTQHTGPSPPLQSAFIWAIFLSCSTKFFHLKRALGLITLGRIECPISTFACFLGRAFLGTACSSPYVAKLKITKKNQFGPKQRCCPLEAKLDCTTILFAPVLGGACAIGTNTMALIQTC